MNNPAVGLSPYIRKIIKRSSKPFRKHQYVLENREKPTPQEILFEKFFKIINKQDYPTHKFTLAKQYPLPHPSGFYILDFYEPQRMIAFEVDGGYHWKSEQVDYDLKRIDYLKTRYGITVVCIPNEHLENKKKKKKLRKKVVAILDSTLSPRELELAVEWRRYGVNNG